SKVRRSPVSSDSTSIRAVSNVVLVQIVMSTAFPPGRICGQRWDISPFLPSGTVKGFGVPPPAETRNRPDSRLDGVKMMVSSGPQLAPRLTEALHRVKGAPPLTETFFSLPSAKNPTHCPSGEKNGVSAPSVPWIGVASKRSRERK